MSRFIVGLTVAAGLAMVSTTVFAADYAPPPQRVNSAVVVRHENPYCGCNCGCPIVTFVRHRELRWAHPASFDPREFEDPNFYYGPMKTYPRFENNVPSRPWWPW